MTKLIEALTRLSYDAPQNVDDLALVRSVMQAAGISIGDRDAIDEVDIEETANSGWRASITWYWIARGCGNTEYDTLDNEILTAEDPIYTAKMQHLKKKWKGAQLHVERHQRELQSALDFRDRIMKEVVEAGLTP